MVPPTWFRYNKHPSAPLPWPVVEWQGCDSTRQHIFCHLDKPMRIKMISGENSDEHQTERGQQDEVNCLHPWLIHLGFSTHYRYNKFLFWFFFWVGGGRWWFAVVVILAKLDQVGFLRHQAERTLTNTGIVPEVGGCGYFGNWRLELAFSR